MIANEGLRVPAVPGYFEHVPIDVYDRTIPCHAFIDACNSAIIFRLIEHLGLDLAGKRVLDAGAGSGQVARILRGLPDVHVSACDNDQEAIAYMRRHPELADVDVFELNLASDCYDRRFDAIVCRGVYHHLPKSLRPKILAQMAKHAALVLIADEGILEYETNEERLANCRAWYGYVIAEARRIGLPSLAALEEEFLSHEGKNNADDGGDFKESPSHLLADAHAVNLEPRHLDRIGNWSRLRGGFYVASFVM